MGKKKKKKRVYTKAIRIVSSGCEHDRSSSDRFGPVICDDCGSVAIDVWVRPRELNR